MRDLLRHARSLFGDRKGSATGEFTVMGFPVVIAVLYIVFETGRGLWAHQIMTEGVRNAARYLSRVPVTTDTIAEAETLARTGSLTAGGATLFPWTAAGATFAVNPALSTFDDSVLRVAGSVIEVRATVPLQLSFLSFIGVDPNIQIVAADQARHIGE